MRIRLLAFATAADALGAAERELDLATGSDVAALRVALVERFPRLAPLAPRLAIAVDGALASPSTPLGEASEVALLPPVSGG